MGLIWIHFIDHSNSLHCRPMALLKYFWKSSASSIFVFLRILLLFKTNVTLFPGVETDSVFNFSFRNSFLFLPCCPPVCLSVCLPTFEGMLALEDMHLPMNGCPLRFSWSRPLTPAAAGLRWAVLAWRRPHSGAYRARECLHFVRNWFADSGHFSWRSYYTY